MQFWVIQTLNSLALGGLLFLLSSGFSLIFGLMRIANLTHGALFMLGAYIGVTILKVIPNLWVAALLGGLAVGAFGGLVERFILRRLPGNVLGQVLVTLGIAFIIADLCLILWGGDPIPVPTPPALQKPMVVAGVPFPTYRLVVLAIAIVVALALHLLMERTRLGAMIRAGVDDMQMARAVGIPVSRLFTTVFCLGAALAGAGGLSRPRRRHAAARADRGDSRRRRQSVRRVRRQLHRRVRVHVRHRARARSRIRDPVPADDLRNSVPPARAVRTSGSMSPPGRPKGESWARSAKVSQ
jgi:branched-chain amino acid transport system permease protein